MTPNTNAVRLFSYMVYIACVIHTICIDAILSKPREAVDTRVQQLFDLVQTSQVQESTTFIPFYSVYKQKGAFPVYTKGNFHGTFDQTLMRDKVRFYDNNIFSTSYILTILLEAFSHGGAPQPSERQMLLGIDSFQDYQDKNRPYNHSIVSFWPLKYNPAKHFWQAYPANTVPYLDIIEYLPVKIIAEFLGLVGLRNMDKFFEDFYKESLENKALLLLPADLDTSSIHLAFGATLKNLMKEFPHAWKVWNARNPNRISVFEAIKHYSYRPFSYSEDSNSIDPRTYFYLRHFLDDAKAKGNDVALITTWTQTLSEQKRQFEKGSTMVRGINNICLGVTANAVLGITRSVLSGVIEEFQLEEDPLMTQIYLNSSTLLAHQLDTNLTGRPDLALLYYPTRVQFEWMVSRTIAELEAARRHRKSGLSPLMQAVYDKLLPSGRRSITDRLLGAVQFNSRGDAYFEDFLGADDRSPTGEPVVSGEDRIFCTALVVNTLINIWTYPIRSGSLNTLLWDENTPVRVMETVAKASEWLVHSSVGSQFKPHGAVFSSSNRWSRTLPYMYPGNRYQFLNGTEIWPWSSYPPDHLTSYMVRGYIPPEQYGTLMAEQGFGHPLPRDFHGYNADNHKYMWYWESEPFTYVSCSCLKRSKSYPALVYGHGGKCSGCSCFKRPKCYPALVYGHGGECYGCSCLKRSKSYLALVYGHGGESSGCICLKRSKSYPALIYGHGGECYGCSCLKRSKSYPALVYGHGGKCSGCSCFKRPKCYLALVYGHGGECYGCSCLKRSKSYLALIYGHGGECYGCSCFKRPKSYPALIYGHGGGCYGCSCLKRSKSYLALIYGHGGECYGCSCLKRSKSNQTKDSD
ncbi:hypothetical protein PoB_002550500 [Plakobranchus ocellatus]|uniref:Uncharacterized protein n=1 Tax=Plakobranchus ocellatus TaxID=259542 RepID=A0AAV3ZV07_9GAST|nr:hypothetical protein PoB_002550500 [Plakobranchus ocellatus]